MDGCSKTTWLPPDFRTFTPFARATASRLPIRQSRGFRRIRSRFLPPRAIMKWYQIRYRTTKAADLNMQTTAEAEMGGFGEGFAEGRVGMDGAGDVVEHRPHFDRQREFAGQFGDVAADRLHPEHALVAAPRHDADEAGVVARLQRQRAAIGGEREH